MDDTQRMIRLMRRLKVEMNGAVVDSMRQRGLDYPLSYGVSVVTIRDIAGEFAPDHSLALLLFRQQVRELKLAAAFIDDPGAVTSGQMNEWVRDFTNTEIVEQVVYALFRHVPGVDAVATEWIKSDDPMRRYAGLLTLASVTGKECPEGQAVARFAAIDEAVRQPGTNPSVARAAVNGLRNLATVSPAMHARIGEAARSYAASDSSWLKEIAEELRWQLEYLDTQ